MKNIRYFIAWLVLLALSPSIFASQNTRAPNTDIPPSAELTYTVKAEYNGLSLGGNSFIQWKADKQKYSLQNEARISLFGKILDADSNGRITTLFNYTDHTVTFRENRKASLREITQDRASIVWQLAFIASTDPERLVPGSTLTFQVAGRSKIEPWTFHVVNTGNISTPRGKTKAIQFSRNGKKGQKMNVWLAPDHNWYPVQILFDEPGGLQLLQTIKKITPL